MLDFFFLVRKKSVRGNRKEIEYTVFEFSKIYGDIILEEQNKIIKIFSKTIISSLTSFFFVVVFLIRYSSIILLLYIYIYMSFVCLWWSSCIACHFVIFYYSLSLTLSHFFSFCLFHSPLSSGSLLLACLLPRAQRQGYIHYFLVNDERKGKT